MPSTRNKLAESSQHIIKMLQDAPDLRTYAGLNEVLRLLNERRTIDLSDMLPEEQAHLIATRSTDLLPSVADLASRISAARAEGRDFIVKFGIDPTSEDVHIGHTVPMIIANRFQRMGHHVILIVGDITAKIGDPSGRSADRPHLTNEDIQRNLTSYRDQVSPFFDFTRSEFRFNSEWLAPITLPELIGVLERIPAAAALQREDFRKRLSSDSGLTLAEVMYSVVMALDSERLVCDLEIGGVDQLLNMQMCRRVMENAGQTPEIVVTTPLIEGIDGSGAKMSKSRKNYIGLSSEPDDIFGKIMSIPDRLIPEYFRTLTELLDPEIELLASLMESRAMHPMGVKMLLAGDVVDTIHGTEAALQSQAEFLKQFSEKRFSALDKVPAVSLVEHASDTVAEALVSHAGLLPSRSQVRRIAKQGGLRLVRENDDARHETVRLDEPDASLSLDQLRSAHPGWFSERDFRTFLKCGRALVELVS